jgi:MFS transporter, DHA3 family, tetracycline resistance protein
MSVTPAASHPVTGLAPLRNRNFALLWSGQSISIAGNGMFMVALPLEVLRITHSPLDLALVVAARLAPWVVLLLVGGTVVDRFSRRAVMLTSDITCGLALAIFTVLAVVHAERMPVLIALSVVIGAASAFFRPASTAIVRDILPAQLLMPANSLSTLSESLAQFLVGPLLGGVLIAAVGATWAFGIDAATFAVSAACLAAMRHITEVKAVKERLTRGIAHGLRYCYSQPWLWWSLLALALRNMASSVPSTVTGPLMVKDAFHGGAEALGIWMAASGGAAALTSIFAASRAKPRRPVRTLWTAWIIGAACAAGVGIAPVLWMAVILSGLSWGMASYGNIVWMSTMQERTPATLLGRVSSIDWLFTLALAPLGTIGAGAAIALIGVRATVLIGGLIATATGVILLIPRVTGPDKAPAHGVPADAETTDKALEPVQ